MLSNVGSPTSTRPSRRNIPAPVAERNDDHLSPSSTRGLLLTTPRKDPQERSVTVTPTWPEDAASMGTSNTTSRSPPPEPATTAVHTHDKTLHHSSSELSQSFILQTMKDQPPDLLGLVEPNRTHSFQGYGGLWFRDYAHAAAFRSAFNRQYIHSKLLGGESPLGTDGGHQRKRQRPKRAEPSSLPRRASRRIAKLAVEQEALEEFTEEIVERKHKQPRSKTKVVPASQVPPLTMKQATQLTAFCQGNGASSSWLESFETYLTLVEQISPSNKRNVLRQVRRLVQGEGIDYAHWAEGVAFVPSSDVHLGMDLGLLLEEAHEFEREHGRDLGNGWLLRHPIQKLINYQQYVLQQQEQSLTGGSE